ncbi:MAG: hypothetical protein UT48_C0007G0020 [Parcubacteria group bacterium GW2011_GWE2_39_37]|uniref:Serine aminopeptidase S33 domain-containing protein n=1 Tax=Candidatus Falkowbacteria bacterium GW2011_GWF2_39_8 TaxID=1618642 RepID=A0A0G0PZY9_9BACT|nr:MAG: hypothetical protein UT48_C0007G0020 [Parcubacteria group bacterium GW2011_GWE2_39_37]KKR33639.1 MAG: hypothetical protein UT64_C0005G0019 [Candidatus Falkowbacteria bacterium GW2011_GWF2_39_8]
MEKLFIKNRKEQKISVIVERAEKQAGLAFVMHGMGVYKEQPQLEKIANAFKENKYTVVRFDATNAMGESDGNIEDATITNYYEDLEDVIKWSGIQDWYQEPFVLCGHSAGGMCVSLYAEKYPSKVKALAPISTVVSNTLIFYTKEEIEDWKKTGYRIWTSVSMPGVIKKLKYAYYEDKLKHDLLGEANNLLMPVLMIVGDNDKVTPLKHQQVLFDRLPGKKELHVIKNAKHNFDKEEHLKEIKTIFMNWIDKI